MARKRLDDIEYCKGTTIAQIREMLAHHDTKALAEVIYRRFKERFMTPLKSVQRPHGFFTMAICCLLIEAIQRYRQGLKDETQGEKEDLYGGFFNDFPRFRISRAQGRALYHTLRSGVLHLGETKGWLIRRTGKLIDFETKTINATRFRRILSDCLKQYRDILKKRGWNTREWNNVRNRLTGFFEYSDLDYEQRSKN